jgi:hypothetical protein
MFMAAEGAVHQPMLVIYVERQLLDKRIYVVQFIQ